MRGRSGSRGGGAGVRGRGTGCPDDTCVAAPAEPAQRQACASPTTYAAAITPQPFTDLIVTSVAPAFDALPALAPGLGSAFVDSGGVAGRIALCVSDAAPRRVLVVEHAGWSVACPLSDGQLHRLTNALLGRGTRSGVRPLACDGAYVHLSAGAQVLVVERGDRRVEVPAGPDHALAAALRAAA